MISLPMLALPDFSLSFEVTIDASNVAIGQEDEPTSLLFVHLCLQVIYSGKENVVVNALSHLDGNPSDAILAAPSSSTFSMSTQLKDFYSRQPWLNYTTTQTFTKQHLVAKLHNDPNIHQTLPFEAGLVYLNDHIFIPLDIGLIPSLIVEFHSSLLGGTLALRPLYLIFLLPFFWPDMHIDYCNQDHDGDGEK
ncbi:hypothetical protein CR513_37192, partial [Mucuna pruriens]